MNPFDKTVEKFERDKSLEHFVVLVLKYFNLHGNLHGHPTHRLNYDALNHFYFKMKR